jgi:hypothetical protein
VTKEQAERVAETLLAAFPTAAARPRTAELFARYLGDLDAKLVDAAVEELILDSPALPSIAEIRRHVVDRELQLPTPLQAWQTVAQRGHEVHPLAKEVVDLFGGLWTIRNSEESTIMRAQFLRAYGERREEELRRANVNRFRRAAA